MAVDVRVFLYNESEFLTLSSILKPLSSAANFLPDYARPGYDVSLCSFEGGEIEGPWGCHVSTRSINDFPDCAHTFVICGGPGFEAALNVPGLIDAIRRQAAGAKRLCVAGAGVFLAAEAGLISTEAVAAHTSLAPWLKLRHPQLRPDNTALLIGDDLLLTCAGFSAGIDLALTLIERDWGYRVAVNVAKYLMVYKKRTSHDKQTSDELALQERSSRFGALHDWLTSNIHRKIDVQKMADIAGMSVRNFTRTYVRELGISPAKMLEDMRVEMAARCLVEGHEYTSVIASKAGFANDRTFCRAFQRHKGMSPSDYRAAFAKPAVNGKSVDKAKLQGAFGNKEWSAAVSTLSH